MRDDFLAYFACGVLLLGLYARRWGKPWRLLFLGTALAALGGWGLTRYVGALYYVTSSSMEPTLHTHDVVLVRRRFTPTRGQIVVFWWPAVQRVLLKRVVGLGGDPWEVKDRHMLVNHVDYGLTARPEGQGRVAEGRLFVVGDNLDHSLDSRGFGDVPLTLLQGQVVYRIWPWGAL